MRKKILLVATLEMLVGRSFAEDAKPMNFQLYSQKDNGNWGQIECRDFYKKKDGTWSSKRPVKILSEKTLVVKYSGDNITFSGKKIENEINKICKR